jgi:hypothetical protein
MNAMSRARVAILIVLLCVAGVALVAYAWRSRVPSRRDVVTMLETAEEYVLLSVHPIYRIAGPDEGSLILGSTNVDDRETRDRLNAALVSGLREGGAAAACFNPRHAIRLRHGGRASELVICFECRQVNVLGDGQQIARFTISATPQPTFDAVLRAAGVPLASELFGPTTIPQTKPATLPAR